MRAIAAAVAIREQRDPGTVRAKLADRIAVVIARSSARAIRKRAAGVQRCARSRGPRLWPDARAIRPTTPKWCSRFDPSKLLAVNSFYVYAIAADEYYT